jgi:hypothetical protein
MGERYVVQRATEPLVAHQSSRSLESRLYAYGGDGPSHSPLSPAGRWMGRLPLRPHSVDIARAMKRQAQIYWPWYVGRFGRSSLTASQCFSVSSVGIAIVAFWQNPDRRERLNSARCRRSLSRSQRLLGAHKQPSAAENPKYTLIA